MTNDSSTLANLDECIDFLLKEGILQKLVILISQNIFMLTWPFRVNTSLSADLCGPKAQIKVETEIAVKRIEDFTHDDGLGQDQLLNLIKLATNGKYG